MITIKNKAAIRKMSYAGSMLSEILAEAGKHIVKSGISTAAIDAWIEEQLKSRKMTPKAKGYRGYRHVSCISVNDEVVHGVPRDDRIVADGDLVKIDLCASWRGYCADMARCFFVGDAVNADAKKLVAVAQEALNKGIAQAVPGNRISDISQAIQDEVEKHGFGIVRDFAGHGIGKQLHEEPEILNYTTGDKGAVIRSGMTFAIEPMITMGGYDVTIDADGWTARTKDRGLAAHVEDTVVVTDHGPAIITRGME